MSKGTTQAIPVSSVPSGADVKIDGTWVGQTPMAVQAARKTDHLLTVEKRGYQTQSVAITRHVGGAVFNNIWMAEFGLIGWGVNAMSGAQFNLTPETIAVKLTAVTAGAQATPVSQSSAAKFIEELKKLDELRAAKKLTDEEYGKRRIALTDEYSKLSDN